MLSFRDILKETFFFSSLTVSQESFEIQTLHFVHIHDSEYILGLCQVLLSQIFRKIIILKAHFQPRCFLQIKSTLM